MILKLIVSTVLVGIFFGPLAAGLFALVATFVGLIAWSFGGPKLVVRQSRVKMIAEDRRQMRAASAVERLMAPIDRLSAEADELCRKPASQRDHAAAARIAGLLETACDELVGSGIDFDDTGDGLNIRRTIAWARVNVSILQREQPQLRLVEAKRA